MAGENRQDSGQRRLIFLAQRTSPYFERNRWRSEDFFASFSRRRVHFPNKLVYNPRSFLTNSRSGIN
jgi:hypothetical protein